MTRIIGSWITNAAPDVLPRLAGGGVCRRRVYRDGVFEDEVMNIDNLTDREKSVMLARAMGWEYFIGQHNKRLHVLIGGMSYDGEFYDPANMALAWRVLNWARKQRMDCDRWHGNMGHALYHELHGYDPLVGLPPAEAQCLWLDKILELAIEVGLVEDEVK